MYIYIYIYIYIDKRDAENTKMHNKLCYFASANLLKNMRKENKWQQEFCFKKTNLMKNIVNDMSKKQKCTKSYFTDKWDSSEELYHWKY